jgi:hypothetical protein
LPDILIVDEELRSEILLLHLRIVQNSERSNAGQDEVFRNFVPQRFQGNEQDFGSADSGFRRSG